MALFDDEQWNLAIGIAIGVGAAVFGRGVLPSFKGTGRPLAKAFIKSGIVTFDKARESLAHLTENVEDLVAEVRSEMETESQPQAVENMSEQKSSDSGPKVNGGGDVT